MEHYIYNIYCGCGLTKANLYLNEDRTFEYDYYSNWMGGKKVEFKGSGTYKKINETTFELNFVTMDDKLVSKSTTLTLLNEIIDFKDPDTEFEGMVMGGCGVNTEVAGSYSSIGYKYDSIFNNKILNDVKLKMINIKNIKKV